MPIDNATCHKRLGILNSLKSLLKTEGMLDFLLHYTAYTLYSLKVFIPITKVYHLYRGFSRTIQHHLHYVSSN